jgi:hypothetical protein
MRNQRRAKTSAKDDYGSRYPENCLGLTAFQKETAQQPARRQREAEQRREVRPAWITGTRHEFLPVFS